MIKPDEVFTEHLRLRRVRADDLDAAVDVHTDPAANRYRPDGIRNPAEVAQTLDTWIRRWETQQISYWAVELRDTGEVIGFGGLSDVEDSGERILNLYYRFRPSAWGRGYASEMTRVALRWAREHRPDLPVVITTMPDNAASVRLAEKFGFVPIRERHEHGARELEYRLADQDSTIVT